MSTQTATTAARFAMRESGSPDSTSSESDDDVYIPDAEADNHPGRSVSRPSASLAKKVLQRAHAKSNASSVITAPSKITKRKVQRKRARTSTPQRQAQSAQPEQPLGNGELA